jgi:hypothetical protein
MVLCDEAHKGMTNRRVRAVMNAFPIEIPRIAFTATEDYDNERQLRRFFPTLIKEITVSDSVALGRLAHATSYVDIVDIDASKVRLRGKGLDEEELARIMSNAPFWKAALRIRYHTNGNRNRSTVICCRTKSQAKDVVKHLSLNRPAGSPEPALLTDDVPPWKREQLCAAFDRGEIDTIVQVYVLNEGWNAPRCKLMIDLAPSFSLVRAKQKYFRVMTKMADAEAYIWVVLPKNLPRLPLMPSDVLGDAVTQHIPTDLWFTELVAKRREKQEEEESGAERVRRIKLVKEAGGDDAEEIKPLGEHLDRLREVIMSRYPEPSVFLPNMKKFLETEFVDPLFVGTGLRLMWCCGVRPKLKPYSKWMNTLFPGAASYRLMRIARIELMLPDIEDEIAFAFSPHFRPITKIAQRELEHSLGAFMGGNPSMPADEALIFHEGEQEALSYILFIEDDNLRLLMEQHFVEHRPVDELANILRTSPTHIREQLKKGIAILAS